MMAYLSGLTVTFFSGAMVMRSDSPELPGSR
jgi:hypothetical protein